MKKIILITTLLIAFAHTGFSQSRFRNTALDTAAQQVNLGPTYLTMLNIVYPATAIVYLKFYDSYTKPYAYSSSPVLTIQVGTDATLSYAIRTIKIQFAKGCWVRVCSAVSDTATKNCQPATKPLIEINY